MNQMNCHEPLVFSNCQKKIIYFFWFFLCVGVFCVCVACVCVFGFLFLCLSNFTTFIFLNELKDFRFCLRKKSACFVPNSTSKFLEVAFG